MKDKDKMNNLLDEESIDTVIAESSNNRFYKTKQNIAKNTKRPGVNDNIVNQQTESSVSCSKQHMNRKTNKTKQKDKINYNKKLTFPVLKGKESDSKKNIRNDGDICAKNIETHFHSAIDYDNSQTPNT
jgi:hypothetical protein